MKRSKKNYTQAKNLSLFARDVFSKHFAMGNLTKNTFLSPDTVLSRTPERTIEYSKNGKVLLCLRQDKERTFDAETERMIEKRIQALGFSFERFDTDDLSGRNITDKEKVVRDTLLYFQKFQMVVTNRFHGTIFSYITKTPCIALDNSYGKVKECFFWYKGCNYMYYAKNIDEVFAAIEKIESVNFNKELTFSNEIESAFLPLKKCLSEC